MKKNQRSQIINYQTDDGQTKIDVQFQDETAWLTQDQMAALFDKGRSTITEHIQNIFKEGELEEKLVCREFRHTTQHGAIQGKTQKVSVNCYNLDVIISVGYRVKSQKGTQFRIWATQRLKEYIIKGFAMDDERLKQGGRWARYFEELLQRIRDIRSSERNFYQKVTDIYTTSIDYKKDDDMTQKFFATVQNKMHYAVYGKTAGEMIAERADSTKPLMGLTSFKGDYITASDIAIAKNYLSEKEIKKLNLIVSLYLDFAELQAVEEVPMKMSDWIKKLDEFLKASEKKLLDNAGKVSHEKAMEKANAEFEKYKKWRNKNYISDFDREVKKLLKMEKGSKKKSGKVY